MGLTRALLHCGMKSVSRGLLADIFLGPVDRLARLPAESCLFVANHTWRLDVITTALVTKAIHRDYAVLASKRAVRQAGFIKHHLGMVPVSDSPLQNIGALKSLIVGHPKMAVWIFPQAAEIPEAWDVRNSIPVVADRAIKLLNRGAPVVPVHIDVLTVRQIRPAVIFTLGEVVPPHALSEHMLGDLMVEMRAEAKVRLAASCTEYRSILHDDGALFCGYPVRTRMVARYGRRIFETQAFSLTATPDGWEVKLMLRESADEAQIKRALAKALPGVLAANFDRHIRFVFG